MFQDECSEPSLLQYDTLRSEFIPYLINFLRDQTYNLLNESKSSNLTPAKTPLSAKFKRQLSKTSENRNSSLKNNCLKSSKPASAKRVQLFYDHESNARPVLRADKAALEACISTSNDNYSMISSKGSHEYVQQRFRHEKSSKQLEITPRSQRSINFRTHESLAQK